MPPQGSLAGFWTLVLGAGLIGLTAASVLWIVRDRRRRSVELADADRAYFRQRDVRRSVCSVLLGLIGVLMILSTRIDVHAGRTQARLWVWAWLVVLGLLAAVLLLAGLDWVANSRYALRHRRALLSEQRELLADLARARQQGTAAQSRPRRGPPFHDPSLN
jgi:hypothetical protein